MVGTKRVLAMAQPTEQATPHKLQRLHAAFVRDDGTILLQIHGKPVNEAKTQPCTLEIPPPKRTTQQKETVARRVEVPSSALHLGWDAAPLTATKVHPLPIGPVMIFKPIETYVWPDLKFTEGRAEEIRLVQRLGSVGQWEILHLRAQPTAAQARFTIFEVRKTMVLINHHTNSALMPFTLTEDAITDVSPSANKAALFVAPRRRDPMYFTGREIAEACDTIWTGIKALGRTIGLAKKETSP